MNGTPNEASSQPGPGYAADPAPDVERPTPVPTPDPTPDPAPDPTSGMNLGIRVGQGFDVHPFSDDAGRVLVLGGVVFDGERGLDGHSDADVPAHAAADALLGAAGLGDLGQHFPDTDPAWAGANSIDLLAHVAGLVRGHGFEVGNVDIKVVCERPKLAPRRAEMEAALSAAVGAPVTVAGRRAEGLGAVGRGEGIVAYAVAVIGASGDQRDGERAE